MESFIQCYPYFFFSRFPVFFFTKSLNFSPAAYAMCKPLINNHLVAFLHFYCVVLQLSYTPLVHSHFEICLLPFFLIYGVSSKDRLVFEGPQAHMPSHLLETCHYIF